MIRVHSFKLPTYYVSSALALSLDNTPASHYSNRGYGNQGCIMEFYNRERELSVLALLQQQVDTAARMTVLTGRRRVGKTMLALEFAKDKKYLYLFVAKKAEALLCAEYLKQIKNQFDIPVVGEITNFKDIFELLLELSKREAFVLILDEFQEFKNINSSVYSDMQCLWDLNKAKSKMHLLCAGSVYSLMYEIFENNKEPLYGRSDRILRLRPFTIPTIHDVLLDHNISSSQQLFDYYVFTGGIPKYLDILTTHQASSFEDMLNLMLEVDSPFINEGRDVLIGEFGRDHAIYFSILELISIGKTARADMESILNKDVGTYLQRLEEYYAVIRKFRPIDAKPTARIVKYEISDNFLKLWFRFIYRNRSAVESGNFNYIKQLFEKNYRSYCGKLLEKFYHELIANTQQYNRIGSYWERGYKNEIDIVAINDAEKRILIADVKLVHKKTNIDGVKVRALKFLQDYQDYQVRYLALSLDTIQDYMTGQLF